MIRSLVTITALLLAFSTIAGTTSAAAKDSPWGASYFPNVPLVTQEGKTVLFWDDLLKDKKVLVNFTYTRCEKSGPLNTMRMAQVQQLLGARVGREIFMYSITLDPEHDTPEEMKAYSRLYGARPGWLFLTGTRPAIDLVRYKFGERREKEEHADTVRIGDVARGRWMRIPLATDPNYLFIEITKTLDPAAYAGKPAKSIAEAPLRELPEDLGEMIFMERCVTCHAMGMGSRDRVGPDLKGVTSRWAPAWLFNYIAAPDYMRANKDPLAVELARHSAVPMPNLRLTKGEVTNVIGYLEAQDALASAIERKKRRSPSEKYGKQ